MSIFSFLKSTPQKTVDDLLDKDSGLVAKAGAWIGNNKFTAEEQAELSLDLSKGVQKFVVETLSENTDRSKARRNIAETTIKFYLLLIFWCALVFPFNKEWAQMIFNLTTDPTLAGLVISISLFFFGSHALAKYQGVAK